MIAIASAIAAFITSSNLEDIRPSDFVEFEATVCVKRPLIEIIEYFFRTCATNWSGVISSRLAECQPGQWGWKKSEGSALRQNQPSAIRQQIDLIRSAVTTEGNSTREKLH